ncbi:MAG: glycerophosphodiester phosphodiesterase family protein [Proteobacteria bacterium]|nr:glycerophosphodiester phosphodiesterase family protein [Pseudomonadota bacterium]
MHARRLYAHRGASIEAPENTMVAFQRAVELGVDALEMDVHITRDDQIIVVHDDTAQRMCGTPLPWATLDLADAQHLDAGWGFLAPDGTRPFAGQGLAVPRFADVLAAFPGVHLNVDIKHPRAAAATVALIEAAHAVERVTLASFDLRTLVGLRRKGYAGPTALAASEVASLATIPALLWRQLPYTGGAAQVPVKQGPFVFDRTPFIAKCHAIGLRVDFWVIDDPAEAARLLALGADGIMTNDPAALRSLFV